MRHILVAVQLYRFQMYVSHAPSRIHRKHQQ